MNKRGFTLIELLAVIVLLAVIAIITTPVIVGIVSDSSQKISNEQQRLIINAAKRYVADNLDEATDNMCKTPADLRSAGYLKKDDTSTGKVTITYDSTNHQYTYSYSATGNCP